MQKSLITRVVRPESWASLLLIASVFLICGLLGSEKDPGTSSPPATSATEEADREDPLAGSDIQEVFGRLPLVFEENRGQTDPEVRFLSRGPGYGIFLTHREAVLVMGRREPVDQKPVSSQSHSRPVQESVIKISLLDSNPEPEIRAIDTAPGRTNYYLGRHPSGVQEHVPSFEKIAFQEVYPGIDLVYYGNQRRLEYDFQVAPGRDPGKIRLRIQGANSRTLDEQGNLLLGLEQSSLRMEKPIIYQEIAGLRQSVEGEYVLRGQDELSFRVGDYDRSAPLIIDPIIAYSSYLGGSSFDEASGIALDANNNIYVVGFTVSFDFPIAPAQNPPQKDFGDGSDAFILKLNPEGTSRIYATFFGGSDFDSATGIAVDAQGFANVSGQTGSQDLFVQNPIQASYGGGGSDAFALRLTDTGTLVYSTYLGGTSNDFSAGIAVDPSGIAFLTGSTFSPPFAMPVNRVGPGGGGIDIWVARIDPGIMQPSLGYFTYLGGSAFDSVNAIAVFQQKVYLTGHTQSGDFPVKSAFQPQHGFNDDAFVTVLNEQGNDLIFSTYLGGELDDFGNGIATEPGTGFAVVTGITESDGKVFGKFPIHNAFQPKYGGGVFDAFVARFSSTGSLIYSTFLGGCLDDIGQGVAVDAANPPNAYVTGYTGSANFPLSSPIQSVLRGDSDAFVTRLNASGTVAFSTFFGGSGLERASGIAVTPTGTASIAGFTDSADFPVVGGAIQGEPGGDGSGGDAFVTRMTTDKGAGEMLPPFAAPDLWTRFIRADTNQNGRPDPEDETITFEQSQMGDDLILRAISPRWSSCEPGNGQVRLSKSNPADPVYDTIHRSDTGSSRRTAEITTSLLFDGNGAATAGTESGFEVQASPGARVTGATVVQRVQFSGGGAPVETAGQVQILDENGDGIVDSVSVQVGELPAVVFNLVLVDVNGDGKADFGSIPWALSQLVGVNATDGIPDPQVFLPLGDTNGDGIPDSPAFDFNQDNLPDAQFPLAPLVSGPAITTQFKLYFAQFGDGQAGGASIFSQISLVNLSDAEAQVVIEVRDDAGALLPVDFDGSMTGGQLNIVIPARGSRVVETDGEGALVVGSAVVRSNRPLSGVILFGGSVGVAGVGSSQDLLNGFCAPMEMIAAQAVSTGIAIQSLETEALTADLQLFDRHGTQVATARLEGESALPGLGHVARFLNELPWMPAVNFADFTGVLKVVPSGRVAATVIQVRGNEFATQPVAPIQTFRPAQVPGEIRRLLFAQFGNGAAGEAQIFSQIILMNLDRQEDATADIEIRDDSGALMSLTLEETPIVGEFRAFIPAGGVRIFRTDGMGAVIAGSVTVTSNRDLAGVVLFGGSVGVAGVGDSVPLPNGFVAPIETDLAAGTNTGFAVMNLGSGEVTADLELCDPEGQLVGSARLEEAAALPPLGHLARFVNEFTWNPPVDFSNFRGTLKFRPSSGVAATVIQVRPGRFATMPVSPP